MRERRKSRKQSQLLPAVSSSHTTTQTIPAEVRDTAKDQLLQPISKVDSETVDSAIVTTPSLPIGTRKTPLLKKEMQKEKKVVLPNIITSTVTTLSEGTEQSFEEHSILLAKLKVSTRRTDRKSNRARVNMLFMQTKLP